jgi:predicted ATP-dependent serine protease
LLCFLLLFQLGVLEMSEFGLQAVLNPSEMFLTEHDSDSEVLAGLAVAVILDGSRAFAIEVQVLYVMIILCLLVVTKLFSFQHFVLFTFS